MTSSKNIFKDFDPPIRSEIFSSVRLEAHGKSLALAQAITDNPRSGKLIAPRVAENRLVLEKSYLAILEAIKEQRAITPAGEWLVDNFHIVRAQLRDIRDHLPPAFYRELPKLSDGPLAGYPRVYGIAWAFIAHTDSHFDPELLRGFLDSYQKVQPLTIGELWAIPITINVVLIENLRRLSVRIINSQIARKAADLLVDQLLGLSETDLVSIEATIALLEKQDFVAGFGVQLLQRLRFQDSKIQPLLEWLEKRLGKEGLSADEIVSIEHLGQTAANATVRNIITSSRLISVYNWQEFFEDVSYVDRTLLCHVLYGQMDFATRNRYRQAVEELSRFSPLTELEIAQKVIDKSDNYLRTLSTSAEDDRFADPGYYLISSGRFEFEKEIGFRAPRRLRLVRFYMKHATFFYLGNIIFWTLFFLAIPLLLSLSQSILIPKTMLVLLSFLGLFPASEIAIAFVNRITIARLGPRHLARFSLEDGIPSPLRTFVVVPTLFTDIKSIANQLEQLEIHYLSNPSGEIYFALLTDWLDSKKERTPADDEILKEAHSKLKLLNAKYPVNPNGLERFYIYHRRRIFNPAEEKWIGWERKRGKLHEFNRLLLGDTNTSFISLDVADVQHVTVPPNVRYVVTLDSDTKIPRGAVAQLVGTIAHPLNRARLDPQTGRVVGGFGILQPRITPSLPSTQDSTIFQRLSADNAGLDPYASAVSDVYQDLFGEGSFSGKGIYDVRIFEAALRDRIPENSLLSHDLLEGNFARCGFLSDVELFEDFPSHSEVAHSRTHRWTRGDWQLLPWLFGSKGRDLSVISKWKMFDNLRRSLFPIMTFLTIIGGLALRHSGVSMWLIMGLVAICVSTLVTLFAEIIPRRRNLTLRSHFRFLLSDFLMGSSRFWMDLVLLPHRAWLQFDAIVRALYRLFISRKKLLEWTTAAQAKSAVSFSLKSFVRGMLGGISLTVFAIIFLALLNFENFEWVLPLMLFWFSSPLFAKFISAPPKMSFFQILSDSDVEYLEMTARKTWRFFSTFVTAEDHFLPPDNFQEDPHPVIAHRSSPTNFGLYLLSVLAARDFGWIGTLEMAERLEATLKSMQKLPRFDGHFYNWYETTEARALDPKYISSVDNGNLAGHLLAVAQGSLEALRTAVPLKGNRAGFYSTVKILETAFNSSKKSTPEEASFQYALEDVKTSLSLDWPLLDKKIRRLMDLAEVIAPENSEVLFWAQALQSEIKSLTNDYNLLFSWSEYKNQMPELSLDQIADACKAQIQEISELKKTKAPLPENIDAVLESLENAILHSQVLTTKLTDISQLCYQLFNEMNFGLLYDNNRKLFSIGYRVADGELDQSYYDLLASEARLTSYIAIAKGDVPPAHWFHLGRGLTPVEKGAALVSWSGSMFEYLMPSIVMYTAPGSLVDQTCHLIVHRQIEYGSKRGVPWGVSESAYNKRDLQLTYQYSNFGVPDLGLKRGLGADLVVAPYATALATMYAPSRSVENLRSLEAQGCLGPFGFYESIDYTPDRLPKGKTGAVIRAYMAHHQGMTLVAIANTLKSSVMRKRFHTEPLIQAAELLLQERTPRNVSITKPREDSFQYGLIQKETQHVSRRYHNVNRPVPTTQLLSNGEYSVMLTSAGSGYSRYRDLALTRWREDVTRDHWGSYFFLRNAKTKKVWSAAYQPTCVEADKYEVTFSEDRGLFTREDDGIVCKQEVFLSPEENAEIRKITLINNNDSDRKNDIEIEITSYCEVVLNTQKADEAHPTFSNLFVQTEYIAEYKALFATRRPRSSDEKTIWMAHMLLGDRYLTGAIQYETDRSKFLGRGRSVNNPAAIMDGQPLSNTVGNVLDPVLGLRAKIRLQSGTTSHITFANIVASSREELLRLVEKFCDALTYERITNLAWTQAQVKLHYLNIEPDEADLFQRMATRLIYSDSSLRPSSDNLKRNHRDINSLWAHGISGDFPIISVRINDIEDRAIIRQLLKAHEYLNMKGLIVDLVILNEKANSYTQALQQDLEMMVHSRMKNAQTSLPQSRGKVFVIRADLLSHGDRLIFYAYSRVLLYSRHGNLAEQIKRMRFIPSKILIPLAKKKAYRTLIKPQSAAGSDLKFFNGVGGFSADGKEYVIIQNDKQQTPTPWINVIAGPQFGFQVSESGSGYTWAENSRENQITPWSNDPVSDPSGETFYIRDLDSNELWTPTALPIRIAGATYVTRHGQGYSVFENISHEIRSELTQFVAFDAPIKISKLVFENLSQETRRLSVSAYVEWVLGFSRSTMAPTTITEMDEVTGAIFALNSRSNEYGSRISFAGFKEGAKSFTGDRTEFIGRNGRPGSPVGIYQDKGLSNRVGAGLDPCAALNTNFELAPGARKELIFFLGQEKNQSQAQRLFLKYKAENLDHVLDRAKLQWDQLLTKVQVETPDMSFDLILNRWLLYQTIVCRFWARAGFYQAGGAFGFRDQLQDVMALVLSDSKIARSHILLAASRQFPEGDVQHWWHPPFGRGVRTHFSDDLIWLPYVVSHYLTVTQDYSILDEPVFFIEGPALERGQDDSYFAPKVSQIAAPLYEHCLRALNKSLATGVHGLPLIGSGDWNDGMNRVGHKGLGESVWLAWFLFINLNQFADIAESRGDKDLAEKWRAHAESLKECTETQAWDGEWYRRAYFDDGTPLGSADQDECQIDSLSQTWAVISGAANPARAKKAMNSVEKILLWPKEKMILLFTPPFSKTLLDPGYIKGYLPGVRENGGQYTHAAIWYIIAQAMLGEGKKATDLFSMLNPINHSADADEVLKYKVEPYVLAADVYSAEPYIGRGGWTWYTGSCGWMYRAGLEFILGFQVKASEIIMSPCISPEWKEYKIRYRFGSANYEIIVQNPNGVSQKVTGISIDGQQGPKPDRFSLVDDGKNHKVIVVMG